MTDPRRGTAAVSLMWVIALAVVTLFAIVFGYMQMQQRTDLQGQRDQAQIARGEAELKLEPVIRAHVDLSGLVGYTPEQAGATASMDAVRAAIDEAKVTFPSGKEGKTLQQVLAAGVADYNAKAAEARSLIAQSDQLRNELTAARAEFDAALREKEDSLGKVRGELEDLRTTSNTQILDAERQRDSLRESVRESERQLSELRLQLEDAQRTATADLGRLSQRNDILSERLNAVARQASLADGSVLTVSVELGRAWIDRGRLHRIRPGMEFQVRSATSGRVKGQLRVVAADDRRSEAEILSQADPFDPIGSDDLVFNDLYDPGRTPVAVLLGNGFGKMSVDDMKALLQQVGIRVEQDVTAEVDYLILGTPFFDPDTGDLIPWTSQEAYSSAEALSVQIVPFRDAMAWLGL